MKKRIIGLMLVVALLFGSFTGIVEAKEERFISKSIVNGVLIEEEYIIGEDGQIRKAIPPVFQGYVQNVDYSDPERFLDPGTQMIATDRVKIFAKKINDKKDLTTVREIWREMMKIQNKGHVDEVFKFSADDILRRNERNDCISNATLFTAIARYKGIPTVYIYAVNIDYLQGKRQNANSTHMLAEVYIDGIWYLVDPTTGKIFLDYDVNNFNYDIGNGYGYYLFSKSIDLVEADLETRRKAAVDKPKEFFRDSDFKWEGYTKPNYKFIDIRKGQ